ncbi:SSI family serine proteinase inhibitor, partial [Streptomyces hyaluromycini]
LGGGRVGAAEACAELRGAGGDPDALAPRSDVWCTKLYDPVVVTVEGVWQGKRVSYEHTFGNQCMRDAYGTSVFAF